MKSIHPSKFKKKCLSKRKKQEPNRQSHFDIIPLSAPLFPMFLGGGGGCEAIRPRQQMRGHGGMGAWGHRACLFLFLERNENKIIRAEWILTTQIDFSLA